MTVPRSSDRRRRDVWEVAAGLVADDARQVDRPARRTSARLGGGTATDRRTGSRSRPGRSRDVAPGGHLDRGRLAREDQQSAAGASARRDRPGCRSCRRGSARRQPRRSSRNTSRQIGARLLNRWPSASGSRRWRSRPPRPGPDRGPGSPARTERRRVVVEVAGDVADAERTIRIAVVLVRARSGGQGDGVALRSRPGARRASAGVGVLVVVQHQDQAAVGLDVIRLELERPPVRLDRLVEAARARAADGQG